MIFHYSKLPVVVNVGVDGEIHPFIAIIKAIIKIINGC